MAVMAFIYGGRILPDENDEVFLAEIFMRRARIREEDARLRTFYCPTDPAFWTRRDELQEDLAAQVESFGKHLGLELVAHETEGKRSEVELRAARVAETLEGRIEQRLSMDRLVEWFEQCWWGDRAFVVMDDGERVYVSDGDFWRRRDDVLEELLAVRDAA